MSKLKYGLSILMLSLAIFTLVTAQEVTETPAADTLPVSPTETPSPTATETPTAVPTMTDAPTLTTSPTVTEALVVDTSDTAPVIVPEVTDEAVQDGANSDGADLPEVDSGMATAGEQTFQVTFDLDEPFVAAQRSDEHGSTITLVTMPYAPGNPGNAVKDPLYDPPGWSTIGRTVGFAVPIDPSCQSLTSASYQFKHYRTDNGTARAALNVMSTLAQFNLSSLPPALASNWTDMGGGASNQQKWLTYPVTYGTPVNVPVGASILLWVSISGQSSSSTYRYVYVDNVTYSCNLRPTPTPTNTSTPTETPTETPTPTPTLTPTPAPCDLTTNDVTAVNLNNTRLRLQPSLYEENWLFEVNAGTFPLDAVTPLPARPWLWSSDPGFTVPSTLTVNSIDVIASGGAINWVDPDILWLQVQVQTTDAITPTLTGYMELTDENGQLRLALSCTTASLLPPTPDPLPASTLDIFSGVAPILPVFDSLQSPTTMGTFGLHVGSNPSDKTGATLDIVTRNVELCIDSDDQFSDCDAALPIPVRSPVDGCATLSGTQTVQINIDMFLRDNTCPEVAAENGDREVVLTHVDFVSTPLLSGDTLSTGSRARVAAGEVLGYMCQEIDAETVCGVNPGAPTHVAFQLRTINFSSGTGNTQQQGDVLGFLAIPRCLYDEWAARLGNPYPLHQTSPFHACPPAN